MNYLHKEKITWSLFKLALPILFILIFDSLSSRIFSQLIARFFGTESLGAYSISLNLTNFTNHFILGVLWSTTIMIGQYYAGSKLFRVKQTISMSIILIFTITVLFLLLWLLFPIELIGEIIGEKQILIAKTSLNINFFGLLFKAGVLLACYILYGFGDTIRPLVFVFISFLLKLILGFVFSFYLFQNFEAIAWAELISNVMLLTAITVYLYSTNQLIRESLDEFKIDLAAFLIHLKIALPHIIQGLIYFSSTFILTAYLAKINSPEYFGGMSIARSLITAPSILINSLIIALTIFTAQNSGMGKNNRIIEAFVQILIGCTIIVFLTTTYFILFSKTSLSILIDEPTLIAPAKRHLIFYSITLILVAANQALNAVFKGSGDTVIPLAIVIFSVFFIKLPISFFEFRFSENSNFMLAEAISLLSIFVFSIIYFASGFYKNWTLVISSKENDS